MSPTVALAAILFLLCTLRVSGVGSTSTSQEISQFVEESPRSVFILNQELLDWKEAFKACRARNYTLAYPSSPTEGEALLSFLVNINDNSTKDIHLGFHSLFMPGNYVYLQGSDMDKVGFWQWDPQSENKTDQRCGALTVDGMKTIDCNTRQESVCKFKGSEAFDRIDGFGYYQLFDTSKNLNWTDAVEDCFLWNANLLVLRSLDEYDAVFSYYSDLGFITGGIDIFYGAHQLFGDQWFLTLADEAIEDSGFDIWAPGEPGDGPGADFPYVGLHFTDRNATDAEAGLFVLPSGIPMQYICKGELHL